MRIFCPAMVVGRPSLSCRVYGWSGSGPARGPAQRAVALSVRTVWAPVHEVGRVAVSRDPVPGITRDPGGSLCSGGWRRARHARRRTPRMPAPYAQPVKDATRVRGILDRGWCGPTC
ncbi:hypothetical protein GCM10017691_53380 [Pseudonocardia petroleophila]